MAGRPSSNLSCPDPFDESFRRAVTGYVGVLAAATALTAAVVLNGSLITLVGATLVAFAVGSAAGRTLSSHVPDLPIRLGRTRVRRAAILFPATAFGGVALVGMLGRVGSALGLAALTSAIAVGLAGYVCSRVARTRSIAAMTSGEPIATYRWQPRQSSTLNRLLLVMYPLLAAMNAAGGDWYLALGWAGLGLFWFIGGLADGRFRPGGTGTDPEIRIYENGLVTQRPYTAAFVPWDEVDHVRLREGELVLDHGLFDVRFDSGDLESPEDVLATVDQCLSVAVQRP